MQPQDFSSLVQPRLQLHWAAQTLSASADATLKRQPDDSHSNFEWLPQEHRLINRRGDQLSLADWQLEVDGSRFPLQGRTLPEAMEWMSQQVGQSLQLRDYDMPQHPVRSGAPFDVGAGELAILANWLDLAHDALKSHSPIRVWPHHFDLGFYRPQVVEDFGIGGGFSLGDQVISEPYFYLNPYGIEPPEQLPFLSSGHWTQHWLGIVIRASELNAGNEAMTAFSFMEANWNVLIQLLEAQ